MCHIRGMRRDDICLNLGPADRAELQALITNRNTARKLVWRSEIVLATADGQRPEIAGLGFARPGGSSTGARVSSVTRQAIAQQSAERA